MLWLSFGQKLSSAVVANTILVCFQEFYLIFFITIIWSKLKLLLLFGLRLPYALTVNSNVLSKS